MAAAFFAATRLWLLVPIVLWLVLWPRREWAAAGGVAWAVLMFVVPLPVLASDSRVSAAVPDPLWEVHAHSARDDAGTVMASGSGRQGMGCLPDSSNTEVTVATKGRIRPLVAAFQETSAAAEFVNAARSVDGQWANGLRFRPDWVDAWREAGRPDLAGPAAAEALGARWHVLCDPDGANVVTDLPGVAVTGAGLDTHPNEAAWHEAAVHWWIDVASTGGDTLNLDRVPALVADSLSEIRYPFDQFAEGVTLAAEGDRLTLRAGSPGWAWIRVPWDPWWHSDSNAPVLKGGPGHLVVWAEPGETTLRWEVPSSVDAAAAAVTAASLLVLAPWLRSTVAAAHPDARQPQHLITCPGHLRRRDRQLDRLSPPASLQVAQCEQVK